MERGKRGEEEEAGRQLLVRIFNYDRPRTTTTVVVVGGEGEGESE